MMRMGILLKRCMCGEIERRYDFVDMESVMRMYRFTGN